MTMVLRVSLPVPAWHLLVQVLGERLGKPSYWRSLIEVAALGTVSDMMPLTPENRALVAEGIQQMRVTARPGYIALAALAKADLSSITADGLSFSLIPRLNAAGRMADPAGARPAACPRSHRSKRTGG